jgi:hypothetical protein
MSSILVRLYPARWRARYGDEFEAILEERPLGPFDVLDIILGALDARLRLRGAGATAIGRSISMSLRIGGYAAIIGGALTAMSIVLGIGVVIDVDPVVPGILFITGSATLLIALAGLSAFQARVHPVLSWTAVAVTMAGTFMVLAGIVGTNVTGEWLSGAFFAGLVGVFAGSTLFAVATYRTGALSRGAAVLLGAGSVATGIAGFGGNALPPVLLILAAIGFTVGWFALGLHAVRIDRPVVDARPA